MLKLVFDRATRRLIGPLDEHSIYASFLRECGEGLHHVGLGVPDYDAALATLRGKGHRVLQGGRYKGVSYAYLSTERDLTERLRVESEMYFRRLADDIPALLRVEDVAGRAQFVNPPLSDFTGPGGEALLGEGGLTGGNPFMGSMGRSPIIT